MSAISRKQKEIADRHAFFLTIAYDLFVSEGWQQLTMNKIAELSEYSRGTVYQHFHCKEEILIQLCSQCMSDLSAMFVRATQFEGNHRERLVAIFLAHDIWSKLKPINQDMLQTLCANGIKEKVDARSLNTYNELDARVISQVATVVHDAKACGDLPKINAFDPYDLVFGLWSLGYGGRVLLSLNLPLQKLGIKDPQHALLRTMLAVLDGLQWRPLSSEHNYDAAAKRIAIEIFAVELDAIKDSYNQSMSLN